MKKFALMGVIGASAVALLVGPGSGVAGACTGSDGQTYNSPVLANLPDGGIVYGAGDQAAMSGYLGASGGLGYIEGNGNATTQSGQIDGRRSDGSLDGRITVNGANSSVCINGIGN